MSSLLNLTNAEDTESTKITMPKRCPRGFATWRTSSIGIFVLLTIYRHAIVWNASSTKSAVIRSSSSTSASTSASSCRPLRRTAHDGKWMSQMSPFEVHAYSAFYDDRWSLGRLGPHVTVVISMPEKLQKIRHCRLWYDHLDGDGCLAGDEKSSASSKYVDVVAAAVSANVIICHLTEPQMLDADEDSLENTSSSSTRYRRGNSSSSPNTTSTTLTDVSIPVEVSLAWGYEIHEATSFRIPIERIRHADDRHPGEKHDSKDTSRRRKLAVCASILYGDGVDPRLIIEWFQMQRLLGVEHVVLYNHSVTDRVGRIVADYVTRPRQADGFTVELRQTRRFGSDREGPPGREWYGLEMFRHQMPILNDCYYRLIDKFQYIGVYDIDELVVPRGNTTRTIVELIESVTGKPEVNADVKTERRHRRLRPASFVFRQALFFRQFAYVSDSYPLDDGDPDSGSQLSYFSVHRRRWKTSPVGFAQKTIIDADGCMTVHAHGCPFQTAAFWSVVASSDRRSDDGEDLLVAAYKVTESVGLVHHYRRCCNLDADKRFGTGYCRSQPLLYDDTVAVKYGDRLIQQLAIEYAKFDLPMTTTIDQTSVLRRNRCI